MGADGIPALRWYVTPQPALVLGVGQPLDDFDAVACRRAGLPMVRRSSGGTAVLTDDGLLNLDVVLPAAHPLGHRDVVRAYAWLGTALTRALRQLGWAACAIAPEEARRDTAALRADERPGATALRRTCFGGRSPYEVLVAGRKVVGAVPGPPPRAGTLYQVGILLDFDAARLAGLLRGPAGGACRGRYPGSAAAAAAGLHTLPRVQPAPVKGQGSDAPDVAMQRSARRSCAGLPGPWRERSSRGVEHAIAETARAG